jgi:hypothetical protein
VQEVAPSTDEYELSAHCTHAVAVAYVPARQSTSLDCDAHAYPVLQGRQLAVLLRM